MRQRSSSQKYPNFPEQSSKEHKQGFFVENGSLDFSILPKKSRFEEEFLNEVRRPLQYIY
uniref:Uncharacterized protein n=1 Tax=Megaselia scalaris TaxID=36166 RepID=T1GPX9_MEGSC